MLFWVAICLSGKLLQFWNNATYFFSVVIQICKVMLEVRIVLDFWVCMFGTSQKGL